MFNSFSRSAQNDLVHSVAIMGPIFNNLTKKYLEPVADPGGRPLRANIFSISCSFSEKSYVGAPPGGLAPAPTGNPGSAPENGESFLYFVKSFP